MNDRDYIDLTFLLILLVLFLIVETVMGVKGLL